MQQTTIAKKKNSYPAHPIEKNNYIDLEASTKTQITISNAKQQHTLVKNQQRQPQHLDPDRASLLFYTNSEPLQKPFQGWKADSCAKSLQSLKKKSL